MQESEYARKAYNSILPPKGCVHLHIDAGVDNLRVPDYVPQLKLMIV